MAEKPILFNFATENKGYKDDFSYILNEINFLGVWSNVDKPEIIYEYFINYGM